MSKIMVVEDDASLREIYSIRITAEGYDVVSAGDGEEALAMAVREKPDLILSDVMMPKISGFDMLDILRSTPETAKIKVIMMTALSAEDQRQRGERLGAEKYLVKSQVGIEDVVNAIHEVLGDKAEAEPAGPTIPEAPMAPAAPVVSESAAPAPSMGPATMAPDLQPEPQLQAQPEPQPQPEIQPRPQPQSEPQAQPQPQPESQPQPVTPNEPAVNPAQ